MNDEKWGDLLNKLNDKFNDVKRDVRKEDREDDVGHVITSTVETVEFTSPMGKIIIKRTTRPKIIDKKTHYNKYAGAGKIEYITSEEETTSLMEIFKKSETGDGKSLSFLLKV